MTVLDCRRRAVADAGRAIIAHYNSLQAGDCFEVRLDDYPPGLRVWLLEGGVRHCAAATGDDGWRIQIRRDAAPAQGSVPGVHHLLSGPDGSIWVCERDQGVARIDGATRRVAAVRHIANKASHLALDPDAGRLFVADPGSNEILALRAADLAVEQRWPAPGMPQLPVVSAEGVVCVTGGTSGTLTIARPCAVGYQAQTLEIGACPHDPLLAGEYLFVPCAGDAVLVKVRLRDGHIAGRCAVGNGPSHLALHPDGSRVYSANSWDGTISCVTTEGVPVAHADSGGWAHAIDITPDGRWVYVANFLDDTLAVFDAATLQRKALLPTEAYPHGLDISPDGRYVVATGFASRFLRIYDAARHVEMARVEVGLGSSHTAFMTGSATQAFVGCSVDDHVACIDLCDASLTAAIVLH